MQYSVHLCKVSILSPPFSAFTYQASPIILVGHPEKSAPFYRLFLSSFSPARIIVDVRPLYYTGLGLHRFMSEYLMGHHCWQCPDRQLQYDLFCHPDCKPVYSVLYLWWLFADSFLGETLISSVVSSGTLGVANFKNLIPSSCLRTLFLQFAIMGRCL